MFSPFGFMGTQAGGGGGDIDATAYINAVITAGGSFSGVEETAIDTFYVNLKSSGIYNKLFAMYPYMGGTSTSNAINATNPGTYDLAFNGTWAHSVSGSYTTPANTNYGETSYNVLTNSVYTTASFSLGYQINNPITSTPYCYMGVGSGASYLLVGWHYPNSIDTYYPNGVPISGQWNSGGHFNLVSRTATNSWFGGKIISGESASGGLTKTATQTSTYTTIANKSVWINNINGTNLPMGGRHTFAFIGQGLSTGETDTLMIEMNTMFDSFTNRKLFT